MVSGEYRSDEFAENKYSGSVPLRANGQLMFDVIGIQSHMHQGMWTLAEVWRVCDMYSRLGLPIHFTETTLVSGAFLGRDDTRRDARGRTLGDNELWGESTRELEDRQAALVERFYTTLFAHPAAEALTWWDFSDFNAWKRAPAGLLRKDMSPKPAYEKLRELIRGRCHNPPPDCPPFELEPPPLVRIHSQCLTGDVFHSLRCDCRAQLEFSLRAIAAEGRGMVVYENKEGRGIGIINKLRAYELQDQGADTVEANERLGFQPDLRSYELPGEVLRYFGMREVRLLSNNPEKVAAVERAGVRVVERLPCLVSVSDTTEVSSAATISAKSSPMPTARSGPPPDPTSTPSSARSTRPISRTSSYSRPMVRGQRQNTLLPCVSWTIHRSRSHARTRIRIS